MQCTPHKGRRSDNCDEFLQPSMHAMQHEQPFVLQVDLSYCPQVALHNLEHFLHSVTSQPHPELKQLTVGFTGMRRSQARDFA